MLKKVASLIIAFLSIISFLSCYSIEAPALFQYANEILTYDPIDPNKTQLVISVTDTTNTGNLFEAFESKNPDIQIVLVNVPDDVNNVSPLADLLEFGERPDIVILTPEQLQGCYQYFEDLSSHDAVSRYIKDSLADIAINGHIFALPGPSMIDAIMYNRTLFAQYGWSVPTTFDEFLLLCNTIQADTQGNVESFRSDANLSYKLIPMLQGFCYEEVLGGIENRLWYNDYLNSNATFAGHMEPLYECAQKLIDAGAIKAAHFDSDISMKHKDFLDGKIAMLSASTDTMLKSDEYEFAFMPFPSKTPKNGYVLSESSYYLSIPIKEHTAVKRDAIDRFISYISSAAGQTESMNGSTMISSVKNTSMGIAQNTRRLLEAVTHGRVFHAVDFKCDSLSTQVVPFDIISASIFDMAIGAADAEDEVARFDNICAAPVANTWDEFPIATVSEDFTVLDVSIYLADMFRNETGADVALVLNNSSYRGNIMRIFKGVLQMGDISTLKPNSLANGSRLISVKMSGKQLLEALNHPLGLNGDANCIYAFSGLNAVVAPWNDIGIKMLNVTLEDGSALLDDAIYTVALWEGTVHEHFLTSDVTYFSNTFEELLINKLTSDVDIAPMQDGRITLTW